MMRHPTIGRIERSTTTGKRDDVIDRHGHRVRMFQRQINRSGTDATQVAVTFGKVRQIDERLLAGPHTFAAAATVGTGAAMRLLVAVSRTELRISPAFFADGCTAPCAIAIRLGGVDGGLAGIIHAGNLARFGAVRRLDIRGHEWSGTLTTRDRMTVSGQALDPALVDAQTVPTPLTGLRGLARRELCGRLARVALRTPMEG